MPNLSLAKITATLTVLATTCSKSAPAPITKPNETPATATAAASAVTTPSPTQAPAPLATQGAPPPTATAVAGPGMAGAKDAAARTAPMGSTTGQMSCGAGNCSGSAAAKKK